MVVKEDIPLNFSSRLINGGPLILVTVSCGCKPNVFTVAWHVPVSRKPVSVAISIGTSNYSHDIIQRAGEYVINVPTADIIDKVVICGTTSGRNVNKFEKAGLTAISSKKLDTPLVEECVGHIECKVRDTISQGDHSVFIGEVVAVSANKGAFNESWKMETGLEFIHHLGGRLFSSSKGILSLKV